MAPHEMDPQLSLFDRSRSSNESELRGLLAEALEGMEHVEAAPGSWLARAREALKK